MARLGRRQPARAYSLVQVPLARSRTFTSTGSVARPKPSVHAVCTMSLPAIGSVRIPKKSVAIAVVDAVMGTGSVARPKPSVSLSGSQEFPPPLRAGTQAVSTGASPSATLVFTIPSGAQTGDTLAIWVATPNSSLTWSVPGSPAFTAQAESVGAGSNACQLFTRVIDGTEGWTPGTSTVTVTMSSGTKFQAGVITANGGWSDPPNTGSGQCNTTSSTQVSVGGITTTQAGDLLMWFGFTQSAAGGTPGTITVPAGFTAQVSQAATSGTGSSVNIAVIMGTSVSSLAGGSTGTQNGTSSASQKSGGLLLGFSDATLPSSGGVVMPKPSVSLAGQVAPTINGGVGLPKPSVQITCAERIPSAGSVRVPKASLSLSGLEIFPAAGSVRVPKKSLSASGVVASQARASVRLPKKSLSLAGAESFPSHGGVRMPKPTLSGTAGQNPAGTISVRMPKASLSGGGLTRRDWIWKAPDKLSISGGVMK